MKIFVKIMCVYDASVREVQYITFSSLEDLIISIFYPFAQYYTFMTNES